MWGTQHWKSPSVSSKAYLDVICWWWVDWMASGEWWWCASEYYEPSQCVLSATTANNSSVCNLWNYRKSNLPTRRRRQTQTHPPSTGELHLSRIIIICARRASGPILHLLYIISAHCAGVDTLYCASFDCCDNCSSDAPVQKLIPWMWSTNSYLISVDYVSIQ